MDELRFSVKALAAVRGITLRELAEESHLDYYHLRQISCGRVKMSAGDLVALSKASGIPADQIIF